MWLLLLLSFMVHTPRATEIGLSDPDGKVHRLLEPHGVDAVVFIFVGVDCPISNGYAPEINRIITDYAGKKIDFYLVYADPALTAKAVKEHQEAYKFACPALLDPGHVLVNRFHVKVTPEVVMVDDTGTQLYQGRIDDLYVELGKKRFAATKHDLRDALDAVVNHRPVPNSTTEAIGCDI
jgi:hypothetical protein